MTDWDALPWWQQRLYVDGLQDEFSDGKPRPEWSGDDNADLASVGFTVQTGTATA